MNPLAILLFILPLPVSFAHADNNWRIAPGVGIGPIRIGLEHSKVLQILGTPGHQEDLGMTGRNGRVIAANATRAGMPW